MLFGWGERSSVTAYFFNYVPKLSNNLAGTDFCILKACL